MKVEFEVDDSAFRKAMERLYVESQGDWTKILRQQTGLLAERLARFTAPLPSKSAGTMAVERDVRRLFSTPKELYDLFVKDGEEGLAKRFWREYKRGNFSEAARLVYFNLQRYGWKYDDLKFVDASGFANIHRNTRNKFGGKGVPIDITKFIAKDAQKLKAYVKLQQKKVGATRAPFGLVAKHYGRSLPGWVTDHSSPQTLEDRADAKGDVDKYITFINGLPWVTNTKGFKYQYQNALDTRARDIVKALELAAKRRSAEASR